MRYYSTRNKNDPVGFAKAALTGLAPDGGLYVPEEIPQFGKVVKSSLGTMTFNEIALETLKLWTGDDVPRGILEEIVHEAYPFSAPLVPAAGKPVLELFHGPTAAFKDFGARFMARTFSYLRRGEEKPLTVLTATSGDTGGAVADGFCGINGISVAVLYPKGRVSELQEKQIAGHGNNIRALAVEGSFDDCQRLVKEAFCDQELRARLALASANSINIARLLPQTIYYAAASGRINSGRFDPDGAATPRAVSVSPSGMHSAGSEGIFLRTGPAVFSVPSGNFGNLTAGLYAYKMGAPIKGFIAATNINRTFPDYLANGNYAARDSAATISNAMDVGSPSNFERMASHFTWTQMREIIAGISVTDDETRKTISEVYEKGYFLDPHTAVGWYAAEQFNKKGQGEVIAVVSTAHPAKFKEILEPLTGPVPLPPSLKNIMERKTEVRTIPAELDALKGCLI